LDQAQQVVNITNVSFRAGAATNIEVIDAERVARDNGLAVAIAEDQLRRARLELLNALGRFPEVVLFERIRFYTCLRNCFLRP
jgi:outer membrane protein TolC